MTTTRTRKPKLTLAQINARAIGPRVVGGTYWNAYWGVTYKVVAVHTDGTALQGWMPWAVTEIDLEGPNEGRERTHCTAWDRRDRVVSLPTTTR